MGIKNLITIRELSSEQIKSILSLSLKIKKTPDAFSSVLKGKTILQFFIENSTRTRMSFEAATRRLGGSSIAFAASASSLSKGETLLDTIQTIKQFGIDLVVMRHSSGGSPAFLADEIKVPVVNAGDGQHEHPTQALLDALTLVEQWGSDLNQANPFTGKKIMIVGDILHSRVARSNIHLLTKLGSQVILCAPQTLLPSNLSLFPHVEVTYRPESHLKEVDAVMALRIQFERQNNQQLVPSKEEYRHFWGMTSERAKQLKQSAVILHPGPMNRGLEIDSEVADSSRSLILKQVENGVWARAAVLSTLL